jgi:N6-adenosine-specific RNA methylase IME4
MGKALLSAETSALEFLSPEELHTDDRFATKLPKPKNLTAIRDDVRQRGIVVPLLVTKDCFVLDGHTRLELARELKLPELPVLRLPIDAADEWAETVTLALNVHRRHLKLAQRCQLVTSLEKIERAAARERMRKGKGANGSGGRGHKKPWGKMSPRVSVRAEEDRATARVAEEAGVSRKTYEKVKQVTAEAPDVARRMLTGEISINAAHKEVKGRKAASKTVESGSPEKPTPESKTFREIEDAPQGHYRCLYVDLAWERIGAPPVGAAKALTEEALGALDLKGIAQERGSHLWLWTTWRSIQEGVVHRLLDRWEYRWSGQVVWKHGRPMGSDHEPTTTTEVLVFATRGILGLGRADGFLDVPGSPERKPEEARALVERGSSGPRVELFAPTPAAGWDAIQVASLDTGVGK